METLKSLFIKPDPQAQVRKCNALIRTNMRKLDRDITATKQLEGKTRSLILAADARAKRDPSRRAQAAKEARDFAREMVRVRRVGDRLVTSRAQLNSVQMQVNEAFAMRKIEGSIKASVTVMRDVSTLVRLPELAITMRDLSVELVKAGIIEEMMDEQLPATGLDEDDTLVETEVDRVLGEILKDRTTAAAVPASAPAIPDVPLSQPQPAQSLPQEPVGRVSATPDPDEEEMDTEDMMNQMRNRLEALKS